MTSERSKEHEELLAEMLRAKSDAEIGAVAQKLSDLINFGTTKSAAERHFEAMSNPNLNDWQKLEALLAPEKRSVLFLCNNDKDYVRAFARVNETINRYPKAYWFHMKRGELITGVIKATTPGEMELLRHEALKEFTFVIENDPDQSGEAVIMSLANRARQPVIEGMNEQARHMPIYSELAFGAFHRAAALFADKRLAAAREAYTDTIAASIAAVAVRETGQGGVFLPVAYANRAKTREEMGDLAGALEDINSSIETDPRNGHIYGWRAALLTRLGLRARALADWKSAAGILPNDGDTSLSYGNALSEAGDDAAAIVEFTRSLKLKPGDAAAHELRGRSFMQLHKFDEAVADFNKAIEPNPNSERAWTQRGQAHLHRDDRRRALSDLNEALRLNPMYAPALANRARVYEELGDIAAAQHDFDMAISIDPNYLTALIDRGTLLSLSNAKQALADFARALEIAPGRPDTLAARANCLLGLKRFDEAITDATAALAAAPKNAKAYGLRAIAYRETDRTELSLADISRAIDLAPRDASHRFHRGIIHALAGRYDRAIADFSSSIEFAPSVAASYANRAVAYRAIGEFERADADDAKAIELEEDSGSATMLTQQAIASRRMH